jgi:hypothetical protein
MKAIITMRENFSGSVEPLGDEALSLILKVLRGDDVITSEALLLRVEEIIGQKAESGDVDSEEMGNILATVVADARRYLFLVESTRR